MNLGHVLVPGGQKTWWREGSSSNKVMEKALHMEWSNLLDVLAEQVLGKLQSHFFLPAFSGYVCQCGEVKQIGVH